MRGGGGSKTSRRTVAGTLAAKVTTEGVAKLTREFNGLWDVLKKVRGELNQINTLSSGGGGMGGVGRGTSTGAAGSQTSAAGRGDAGMLDFSGLARGGGGLMNRIVNRYTGAPSSAATTTRPGGGYSVGNLPVGAPNVSQPPLPGMEPPTPPTPSGTGGTPPGGTGGWGGQNTNVRGPGGFQFFSRLDAGVAVADVGLDVLEKRFGRNVAQSAPISARDAFTAAMYGPQSYRTMEMDRYKAGGDYAGTRENVQSAQQIALGLGQTGGIPGTSAFIAAAGRTAQASGGALTIDQAAAKSALFASPGVANRARALGIMQFKTAGKLNDPKEIALGYIKDFEKLNRSPMNEFDYANARSPGAPIRQRMKQIYNLDDESIDMVLDFGMENMQFHTKTGRDINFANPKDIEQIVPRKALGPTMARYATTGQRREASLFHEQEGAESGRLEQEINLQEGMQRVEEAFADLLTPMHEFGRYLKIATSVLGGAAAIGMLRSVTGGGGGGGGGQGILSQLLRRGGPGGAAAAEGGAAVEGAAAVEGTAAAGATATAGGVLSAVAPAALAIGGGLVTAKGMQMAGKATNRGDIAESVLTSVAGGVAIGAGVGLMGGPLAPITVPMGMLIGGTITGGVAAYKSASSYFAGREARSKEKGYERAIGLSDKDLIDQLKNYKHNASPGGRRYGQGAGPEERGAWDAWAARRGALLAAALDEGEHANIFGELSTTDASELKRLVDFFSGEGVFDDNQFHANIVKARKYTAKLVGTAPWREYFGDVADPAAYQPITTDQANKLVQSGKQVYEQGQGEGQAQGETPSGAPAGDAVFAKNDDVLLGAMGAQARRARGSVPRDPFPKGGDPVSDRAEGMGETWNKLDSRMKDRLLKMFRASGGRVWLGGGWRSEQQQKDMFLSRYTPDPNGSIEWQGQKWRHVSGFAAAPPGRSMHEIGMAADLDGDLGWVGVHGAEFGLKDFSDVNNEPHHVQLAEFPNSRAEFEKSGGTTDSSAGGTTPTTPPAAPQPFSSGGGSSISGIGYSIAAAAAAVSPPGAVSRPDPGTAAAGAATGGPGWTGAWPSEEMERGAATAKVAAAAGFTGQDLVNMVAISFRESGWHTDTWVTDNDDVGGGLWAINQLPWLSKGLTPPWTKEEIQNPTRAAQIAKELFDQRGYQPWTTAGGAMARTDQAHAQAAVAAAHLGDAVFDPGMTMPMPMSAGKANVTINVQITSTGNVNYDAKALGDAVRPALTNVMAEISTKRGS